LERKLPWAYRWFVKQEIVLEEALFRECLSRHPFIAGLPPAITSTLANISEARDFKVGEYLWRQGERADALHFVCVGKVALEIFIPREGPLQIETIGAGDVIACSWVVTPGNSHFDARAQQDVSAVAVDGRRLRERCDDNPVLGYEVLKRLTLFQELRLQKTRLRILELYSH
jgi:CRP-like cAMP-binding protein